MDAIQEIKHILWLFCKILAAGLFIWGISEASPYPILASLCLIGVVIFGAPIKRPEL